MKGDTINRQSTIDTIHKTICGFFDVAEDDSEEPISEKDKLLLEVNKAICDGIKELPSSQPQDIARDIATIIENEKDMRVVLKNAEHTETHSCDYQRTETHDWIPVTERLPKEEDCPMDCLVTRKSKFIGNYTDMAVCEKNGTWTHEDWDAIVLGDVKDGKSTGLISTRDDNIIAWMPLPEPYKGGESDA